MDIRNWGSTILPLDLRFQWLILIQFGGLKGAPSFGLPQPTNWRTTARDRTIRVSLMEDRLLTYEEWHHKVTTGWNDGERWYQGGHSFALYLRDRFVLR